VRGRNAGELHKRDRRLSASENRRRARGFQMRHAAAGQEKNTNATPHGPEGNCFLALLPEYDFTLVEAIIVALRHRGVKLTISDLLMWNDVFKKCKMFRWPMPTLVESDGDLC
jgi:hypothetical protein